MIKTIKVNKTQKTIWTIYLIILCILFLIKKVVGFHIVNPNEIKLWAQADITPARWYLELWNYYFKFGWIIFLTLHLLWKDKHNKKKA